MDLPKEALTCKEAAAESFLSCRSFSEVSYFTFSWFYISVRDLRVQESDFIAASSLFP